MAGKHPSATMRAAARTRAAGATLLLLAVLFAAATGARASSSSSSAPNAARRRAVVGGAAIYGFVGPPIEQPADYSASSAASDSSVAAMDPLYNQILADHNSYRAKHRAPALQWDDSVGSRAKVTVDSCVFAHNAQGDGENIAYTTNLDQSAALAWAVKVREGERGRRGAARDAKRQR